jgi:hypothetical protein
MLKPKGKHSTPAQRWVPVLSAFLKPMAVAVAASAASIFAYVTTPLNEYVNNYFWDEKAELLLISQNPNVTQGDILNVDIIVQPQGPLPISEGTLEIKYSPATLRPGAESLSLLTTATPKITASKKLLDRTLEFIADAPGKAEVTAILKTKTETFFSKTLALEILAPNSNTYPTRRSFSGKWNLDLGKIHGYMILKDVARTLNGEYKLSDGNYGQIEGTRDGKTFRVTFYRGAVPSRFFIEASFDPDKNADLELKGNATLLIPSHDKNNPWKNERSFTFYGVAQAR